MSPGLCGGSSEGSVLSFHHVGSMSSSAEYFRVPPLLPNTPTTPHLRQSLHIQTRLALNPNSVDFPKAWVTGAHQHTQLQTRVTNKARAMGMAQQVKALAVNCGGLSLVSG